LIQTVAAMLLVLEFRFCASDWVLLHHSTTTIPTVRTDWTWTIPVSHFHAVDDSATGAVEEWRMEMLAEFDVDQILFPASWAVCGDVLRAH